MKNNKKIWLNGHFQENFGDDLFLKYIIERYKNVDFFFYSDRKYKYILKDNNNIKKYSKYCSNPVWIKAKLTNLFNRIIKKNIRNDINIYDLYHFDYSVLISGSYFMEPQNYPFNNWLKKSINLNVPYYIIGVNFGPYITNEYFNHCKDIYLNAKDICFRDKYSYDLFKDLGNVRFAPDIVFGLDLSKVKLTNNKNVIISVCNINKNGKNKFFSQEEYEKNIANLILYFNKLGYHSILMSFSKYEGDEYVIENIIKNNDNLNVDKYYYRGNIDEALNILGDSQIIVGTRYHANILGMIMNKTVIPVSYSNKMINVLNDINFKGKYFDLNKKNGFDIESLTIKDLNYKIDVKKQIINSENHFKELDKLLK